MLHPPHITPCPVLVMHSLAGLGIAVGNVALQARAAGGQTPPSPANAALFPGRRAPPGGRPRPHD